MGLSSDIFFYVFVGASVGIGVVLMANYRNKRK